MNNALQKPEIQSRPSIRHFTTHIERRILILLDILALFLVCQDSLKIPVCHMHCATDSRLTDAFEVGGSKGLK